jgi:hypothetical protein
MAALVAICLLAALGVRQHAQQVTLERYDRAISMVTASDSVNFRLGAAPGTPEETHARYRGRPGTTIAIVTFSKFPALPAGQTYQVWARHGGTWTSLGSVEPDADGNGRLIAENPALATVPDAVEVTLEPRSGSVTPGPHVVVSWAP